MSKIRELTISGEQSQIPTANHNMFISSLMPLFRRVKGFLCKLLYAYCEAPDPTGSKAIESPIDHQSNGHKHKLDIMSAVAAHWAARQQVQARAVVENSRMLECILLGLPQNNALTDKTAFSVETERTAVNPTMQVEHFSKSHTKLKKSSKKGHVRPTLLTNGHSNNANMSLTHNLFASVAHSPSPIPPNEHHHKLMPTATSKKSLIKNNREKKRNELTREIHEEVFWDNLPHDDQDTVDHCGAMLESVRINEPSPSNGCHLINTFVSFSLSDFPAMSSVKCVTNSAITITALAPARRRPGISWEVPLDRVPTERPARLERLARQTHHISQWRSQSDVSNAIEPAIAARLSIENIQQYRAQLIAHRAPRERQISEASDDFIIFEESPDDQDDMPNIEMLDDSDDSDDEDSSEPETESDEEECVSDEEDAAFDENDNNNNTDLEDINGVNKIVVVGNPDSGYEDKKKVKPIGSL